MYKLKDNIFKYFLLFFMIALTSGCSRNDKNSGLPTSQDNSETGSDELLNQIIQDKILVINSNKCTGCGKCSRIDSEHFIFDINTNKAKVISQTNTGSINVQTAISTCRDNAISLK